MVGTAKPLVDEAGAVRVYRDVTAIRKVEAERVARRAAEAPSYAKSEFLANMSHEIGIPEDKREAIFESFAQADSSTTRRFAGTGLGLTISARLAALMGGKLRVESELGRGSRFFFTARLGRRAPLEAKPWPGAHAAPGPDGLRILLTEDNAVNRAVAMGILSKRGHAIVVAEDGRAAVAALERGSFDVVLMDVQMPVMGGIEATAAIRRAEHGTGRHVPIVALTAHALQSDRAACLAAGMDEYVPKPFRAATLMAAIERVTKGGGAAPRISISAA